MDCMARRLNHALPRCWGESLLVIVPENARRPFLEECIAAWSLQKACFIILRSFCWTNRLQASILALAVISGNI